MTEPKGGSIDNLARKLYEFSISTYSPKNNITRVEGNWSMAGRTTKTRYRKLARFVMQIKEKL